MGKRIPVTGGVGFVGSHLCRQLLREGTEVVCLDNLFTGTWVNIADLFDDPGFESIRHDICDRIRG